LRYPRAYVLHLAYRPLTSNSASRNLHIMCYLRVFLCVLVASASSVDNSVGEEEIIGLNLLQVTAEVGPAPIAMPIPAESMARATVGIHPDVAQLEDILRPIFLSLPKNAEGSLDPAGVRYALNRYFAHQHGWRIKSLEPEGLECDAESQNGPLLEIAQEIEERPRSLEEVAVLASTFEGIIHLEALQRLRVAYKVEGVEITDGITEQQVEAIVDVYMAAYVLGGNITAMNHSGIIGMAKEVFTEEYWKHAQQFVRDVRSGFSKADRTRWSFVEVEQLAVQVGDQFGPFRHEEYMALKKSLVSMEAEQAQCVPLSKFYGSGKWQFGESADYLKYLGALESSNPRNPSLIIPNYLNAHSNCLAVSSFYSVCFINECDDLIGHLEKKLLREDASPQRIAQLVAALPSASVDAPRTLPVALLSHLRDIAREHHGRIPLHSRLFAQWMHFAFPRECSYPHLSGSTTTLTVDRYENVTGKSPVATSKEMRFYTAAPGFLEKQAVQSSKHDGGQGTCMPWTTDEELVVEGVATFFFDPFNAMSESFVGLLVFGLGITITSFLIHLLCQKLQLGSAKACGLKDSAKEALSTPRESAFSCLL